MHIRISVLLTSVFLGIALFVNVLAEGQIFHDLRGQPYIESADCNYGYRVNDDDTVTIVTYPWGKNKIINVPLEIDGRKVTIISEHAFSQCDAVSINIPEGVQSIESEAFSDCRKLVSISLPETLDTIGDHAFSQNTNLQKINMPMSIESMGMNPFSDCMSLSTIDISPFHPGFTIMDGVLFDKCMERLIWFPMTYECKTYCIPEGVKTLDDSAFYRVYELSCVYIPESVSIIGNNSFRLCESLEEVEVTAAGLTRIGDGAFMECPLKKIILYEGLEVIGENAFCGCQSLQYVKLPASVYEIGNHAFDWCADNLMFIVPKNSYAEEYAVEHGIKYSYTDIEDFEFMETRWIGG